MTRRILALGWLIAFVYAYPGRMSAESFAYLKQARSKFASDAYAPAISALWRLLELVFAGPASLLALQLTAFVAGTYWIAKRWLDERTAAWAVLAVVVFPPVLVNVGAISTASVASCLLACGAGALLQQRRRLGFAALVVATAVVPVLAVATIPLVLFASRSARTVAIVWVLLTGVAVGGDALLAKGPWHLRAKSPDPVAVLRDARIEAPVLDDSLKLGVPTRSSEFQDAATAVTDALAPIGMPWLWLALAAATAWYVRRRAELLLLLASGVVSLLALAFAASGAAPGQAMWLIASVILAAIVRRFG